MPQNRQPPWIADVRGNQVGPLITTDAPVLRVEAGPGTGKTFGLTRRIVRALHPDGLGLRGSRCLVVAFNCVIANDLKAEIQGVLAAVGITDQPTLPSGGWIAKVETGW